jgi:hypothetical protein
VSKPKGPWVPREKPFKIVKDTPSIEGFVCTDIQHSPGPLGLYIPPGQVMIWTCPSCKHVTRVRGMVVR